MISRTLGRRVFAPAARRGPDRGSATVELAVSLPVLVLLLMAALAAVDAVLTELRCFDAAAVAARAAARGEPGVPAGARVAPPGATVTVTISGGEARAVVRARVEPLGGHLPAFDISASAVAAMEPGAIAGPDVGMPGPDVGTPGPDVGTP